MTETTLREITCPLCERVWPDISEQGLVTELYNKCYQCLIAEVIKVRDERMKTADYSVQNCSNCGGLPGKFEKCVYCSHKGWEITEKHPDDNEPRPRAVYQH